MPFVGDSRFQKLKSLSNRNGDIFSHIHVGHPHFSACRATFLESMISPTAMILIRSISSVFVVLVAACNREKYDV